MIKKASFLFFFANYLKEDNIFKDSNKIQISYVYDYDMSEIDKYDKTTFTVIGGPDDKKGNFDYIFKEFSSLMSDSPQLTKDIQLILPMKIRSKNIIKLIKKYNLEEFITFFEEYVPEKEYLQILKRSHYAIIPELFDDASGERKISAGFSYACAYNLPIIVHKRYLRNDRFDKKYITKFDQNNRLSEIIISAKKYSSNEVKEVFKNYNKEVNFKNVNKKINKILL